MKRILSVIIDTLGVILITYCFFSEFQKDEFNQAQEKGTKLETTTYYKICASAIPLWIRKTNAFFVKTADANYHPQEYPMDFPLVVIFVIFFLLYAKIDCTYFDLF